MPVYTYQIVREDGTPGEMFDVVRKMSDPPLTHHPETGEPVKRIFKPTHIAGITSELHKKTHLNEKKLEQNGFTMYKRNGKGHYERRVGSEGPDHISAD